MLFRVRTWAVHLLAVVPFRLEVREWVSTRISALRLGRKPQPLEDGASQSCRLLSRSFDIRRLTRCQRGDIPRPAPLNDPNPYSGAPPGANRGEYTANGTTQRPWTVMRRVRLRQGCERGSVSDALAMPRRTGHRHSAGKPPCPRLSKPPIAEDADRLTLPLARLHPPAPGSTPVPLGRPLGWAARSAGLAARLGCPPG